MTSEFPAATTTGPSTWSDPEVARRILTDYDVWAVVGLSDDPGRAAYGVARFLQSVGKRIVPVHPRGGTALGEPVYRSLADVPAEVGVQVVDVFRRSDTAGRHVDEAIAIGARAVWFQLDVVDPAAYERARAAGLLMVMNRCPKIDWPRLMR